MSNKGKPKMVTLGLTGDQNGGAADSNPVSRNVANFGGPGSNNAEMNRSDAMPSKPGMNVTLGSKTGA